MKYIFLLLLSLLMLVQARAQDDYARKGTDELFELARQKAFQGERTESRKICALILERNPDYHDVKILMARTYAWDTQFTDARKLLHEVLLASPRNEDAFKALIDVELWDNQNETARIETDKALLIYPNSKELLLKKVKVLMNLGKEEEALLTLSHIESMEPGCVECERIRKELKTTKFSHSFWVNSTVTFFDKVFGPMNFTSVQLGNKTRYGSIIGRINYSRRFGENGIQPELDYYPTLWKRAYGYLNYGYSNSVLFPMHRMGGEIFQSFPKSLEASLGFRYLYFNSSSSVQIYTASLGTYLSNYWIGARTYITPLSGSFSRSFTFSARRYLSDANSYFGISGGAGFSPDAGRIQSNAGLSSGNNIFLLKAQNITLNFQKSIRYNLIFHSDLYYVHQELAFSFGDYVNSYGLLAGLKLKF